MRGKTVWRTVEGRCVLLYLPPSYGCGRKYPVIYLHDGEHLAGILPQAMATVESLFEEGTLREAILVGICTDQRNNAYTPWPSADLDGRPGGFGGNGREYLNWIAHTLKPHLDGAFPTLPDFANTGLCGVSLGGLISAYAAFYTPIYGAIASISGSFWYPGWEEFLEREHIKNPHVRILLTCGKYEGSGRFTLYRDAVQCTRQTGERLASQLSDPSRLELRLDNGKHHDKQVSRLRVALSWLLKG